MEKEYEKRYGELANQIGGKKEREQLDILNKISKNIDSQAENRSRRAHQAEWKAAENLTGDAKRAELARLRAVLKQEMENVYIPAVAQEMGVNLQEHKNKKDELIVKIEAKTIDRNKFASEIPNQKIANKIRSEATYEVKDEVSKTLKKLFKDAGIEIPDPNKTTK